MAKREYTGDPIDMTQQHISERDLDGEAERVEYATDSEPDGQERVDFWPSQATPREDLTSTQRRVIAAAADPVTEYESMSELGREVVPEMSQSYAAKVLNSHWPECELTGGPSKPTPPNPDDGSVQGTLSVQDPDVVDEIRQRLIDGEGARKIGDSLGVSKDVVLNCAKEEYQGYEELDTETPPVAYNDDRGWEFKPGDGGSCTKAEGNNPEAAKNGTPASTIDRTPPRSATPTPVASGGGSDDPHCRHLAAVAVAILAWETARQFLRRFL